MDTRASEEIHLGQLGIRFLLEGSASGGSVAMFECAIGKGAKVPMAHSHDAYEETIYGLQGVITFTVNNRVQEVAPGDVLCIPRGAVHRFDNFHNSDSKMLCVITPGILRPDYFREIAAIVKAGGPPSPTAIGDVMRRHGLTPAE